MRFGVSVFRFVGVTLVFLVLVLSVFGAVRVSGGGGGFNVLWVWDLPFSVGNPEFSLSRGVVGGLGGGVTYKSAGEIWLLRERGWGDWLRGAGYDLVVITWSRDAYFDAVKKFIVNCVAVGVPVLVLPGAGWNVTEGLGLVMVRAKLFGVNFSVADSTVTRGVWVVGVSGDVGVVSVFYRVNASVGGVSWEPVVMAPNGGAVVVTGVANGTRVAAVAPYLYAYGGFDNKRLLENIVLWLLGREDLIVERLKGAAGGSEIIGWGSVAVKNLSELRSKLMEEIRELEEKRNTTLMEVNALRENLTKLEEEHQNLVKQINDLKEELQGGLGLMRDAYRALGAGIGVGLIVGFVITRFVLPKLRAKPGSRRS